MYFFEDLLSQIISVPCI